jgi:hypothetical protein
LRPISVASEKIPEKKWPWFFPLQRPVHRTYGLVLIRQCLKTFVYSAKVSNLGKFGDNFELVLFWPNIIFLRQKVHSNLLPKFWIWHNHNFAFFAKVSRLLSIWQNLRHYLIKTMSYILRKVLTYKDKFLHINTCSYMLR